MTDLRAALQDGNVQAFLRVIRAGEGTSDADGYRRHFGGDLFDSFADHPRKAITKRLGGRPITSTAAGAYQFLARTWDECAKALALPDFAPASQDLAAVFLIRRRRALEHVIAGRLEQAIAACAREWASLPGSPYGQPVKSMAECRAVYERHGGRYAAAPADQAPVKQDQPAPTAWTNNAEAGDPPMPLPTFIAAALPAVIQAVPQLGKLFGSGSEVAERNARAAELAVEIVQQAVGAKNAQEAVEVLKADPAAAQAAVVAVQERWFELQEVGGGIEAARKADAQFVASGAQLWQSPAFLISLIMLALPVLLVIDVLYVNPGSYTGELRTQIVTAVLAVISVVAGYWIGTSWSSAKKDERVGR